MAGEFAEAGVADHGDDASWGQPPDLGGAEDDTTEEPKTASAFCIGQSQFFMQFPRREQTRRTWFPVSNW